MNDLDVESGIADFVVRSESAKNDLFSKFRLHCLYVGFNGVVSTIRPISKFKTWQTCFKFWPQD